MSKVCAIVPAAGRGIRMGGGKPKQFLELSGRPILAHTLCALSQSALIDDFFVVVPEDFIPSAREIVSNRNWYTGEVPVRILPGGRKDRTVFITRSSDCPRNAIW